MQVVRGLELHVSPVGRCADCRPVKVRRTRKHSLLAARQLCSPVVLQRGDGLVVQAARGLRFTLGVAWNEAAKLVQTSRQMAKAEANPLTGGSVLQLQL